MYNYIEMPADASIWVYQSNREFAENEIVEIRNKAQYFVDNWTSHKKALKASFEIYYSRFIVFFVDQHQATTGGCSIDVLLIFVQNLEKEFDLKLLDRMQVAYRINDKINTCTISEFERLIEKKEIDKNTVVFNNLVSTKLDFETKWEVPLENSWHWQNYMRNYKL